MQEETSSSAGRGQRTCVGTLQLLTHMDAHPVASKYLQYNMNMFNEGPSSEHAMSGVRMTTGNMFAESTRPLLA